MFNEAWLNSVEVKVTYRCEIPYRHFLIFDKNCNVVVNLKKRIFLKNIYYIKVINNA